MMQFLGHDPAYWLELQRRFEEIEPSNLRRSELFEEIIKLRAKLSAYESRLDEMNEIRKLLP